MGSAWSWVLSGQEESIKKHHQEIDEALSSTRRIVQPLILLNPVVLTACGLFYLLSLQRGSNRYSPNCLHSVIILKTFCLSFLLL